MTKLQWHQMTNNELLATVDRYIHELDMAEKPTMTAVNRRSTDEIPLKQLVAFLYRSRGLQWSEILIKLGYPAQVRTRHIKHVAI